MWKKVPVVVNPFTEKNLPAAVYIDGQFVRVKEVHESRCEVPGKGRCFVCKIPGAELILWHEYYWGEWFLELSHISRDTYVKISTMESIHREQEAREMCAHYTLFTPEQQSDILNIIKEVERKLKDQGTPVALTTDEIYPKKVAPVLKAGPAGLDPVGMTWGYPRRDPEKPKNAPKPVCNTKAETAARIPMWAESLELRRCLVPCTGFYERKKAGEDAGKEFLFQMQGSGLFYMAGIYAPPGADDPWPLEHYSILTTMPNRSVKDIHPRMPIVLRDDEVEEWLRGD